MRLFKGEFKSYSIDELSNEAKESAYEKWSNTDRYYWAGDEAEATLKEFCRLFDITLNRWEYNAYSHSYRFSIQNNTLCDNEKELSGIRLATYVWNNYAEYISKGKYYSLWSKTEKNERFPTMGKLKSRHSKIMMEMDNCPLTGVCYDYYILQPIIDCLTYKKTFSNYEELIDECLHNFFSACVKECEYHESMEYFIEEAQANGYEYDERGKAFYLPYGFRETA